MTDTVAENMPQEATDETLGEVQGAEAQESSPKPNPEDLGDSLAQGALAKAQSLYGTIVKIASRLKAASNKGELLSELIAKSTDPEVVKRREAIEKRNREIEQLNQQIEELVKPELKLPSEDEIKELQADYKVQVDAFNTCNKMFKMVLEPTYPELDITDYTGPLPSGRVSTSTGNRGDGPARPRLESVAISLDGGKTYNKVSAPVKNAKTGEMESKSTLSVLAAWLKKNKNMDVTAGTLAEEWLKQNKVDSWEKTSVESTFVYSENSTDVWVKVIRQVS